ncbi:TPA: acetolactate synthase large subunit [Methanopyrus kandleri]|uniref:Acetolactate synthase n=1 Tax=Methanopyrus kandleri TaxID=2320 RepID=A0A832WP61_9EURY|nr:acetolactate synthase large subunit [Methanopyrus kandleri]HII70309.1 acetolactate synthase large subunit [Methanopyrus kandleri]
MPTGARVLVECLKEEGVEHIFGYPGGAVLPIYDEIYDEVSIEHILVRHEQGAAHAADGYARVKGKPGVCMATSGPGATNLVTGIATAYMDSSPVIAITGQVPTTMIGKDAFQEVDAVGVFMPITKHNYQIGKPEEIPEVVKEAFKIAITGRPGPVHIDVPKDVQEAEVDVEIPKTVEVEGLNVVKRGHPVQIKRAAELLAEAERPVILAGGGCVISNATRELIELAELLGAPVATTLMGKGAFPEDHPLALGMAGMHGTKAANYALTECDVLLAVGCRFSDRTTGDPSGFAPEAKIIHIDIDPAEIGKNIPVDVPIVGDAKLVLRDLIKELKRRKYLRERKRWGERIEELKAEVEMPPESTESDQRISPRELVRVLHEALKDRDYILTTDVGQNQMWMARYFPVEEPRRFISSGGLGTMGFGLPAALGAKVAAPEKTVVAVVGDGGFLMTAQELATAVDNDIEVKVFVMDNRLLGMVAQWQRLFYDERLSESKLDEKTDIVKLTESYGAAGITVEEPSELESAVEEAFETPGTVVVDVFVDPEEIIPMVPPGGELRDILGEK